MGSELILGVRLNPQTLTTIKLNDVNFKITVEDFKHETAGKVNLSKESFELIYCGCILEDELTLESCGLKNGAMVHVLKKKEPEAPTDKPKPCLAEAYIVQLASAFKSYKESPSYQSALHRVSKKPEVIDEILTSYSALNEDAVAIAMLQDPNLMAHFADVDTVRRVAEAHPVLAKAALTLAIIVYEEARDNPTTGSNSTTANNQPTGYSYSIDNLSDDEEMAGDSSQSSDSTQPSNLTTNQLNSMQRMLLNQLNSRPRERGFPLSNSPSSTSSGSTNSGVITTEMFTQAMQQAFATTPAPIVPPTLPPILPPVLPQFADLQRQLAQMHEMGLQDDTVNVQALQFTNGDVQAAIELVFSGFSDN